MSSSPVTWASGADVDMQKAGSRARETFRYFWRELAWERRRIVPGLTVAAVKSTFWDGGGEVPPGAAPVEEMWVGDAAFDGRVVRGQLLNQPDRLESVAEGDAIELPLSRLTDWLYAMDGVAYGAFTVQVLRSRMDRDERRAHDDAWDLDFGDPASVRLVPPQFPAKPGSAEPDPDAEHPLSENMAHRLRGQLQADRSFLAAADDDGFTLLHHLCLAGSAACVRVALEFGPTSGSVPVLGSPRAIWPRSLAGSAC